MFPGRGMVSGARLLCRGAASSASYHLQCGSGVLGEGWGALSGLGQEWLYPLAALLGLKGGTVGVTVPLHVRLTLVSQTELFLGVSACMETREMGASPLLSSVEAAVGGFYSSHLSDKTKSSVYH